MIEFVSVPIIATIVYWIINLIKYTTNNSEKFLRFVPVTAAGIGAIIGLLCFFLVPDVYVANNFLTALVVGAASGLAATGTNQAIKQLSSSKEIKIDDIDTTKTK